MVAATIYSSYASESTELGFKGVVWFYIATYVVVTLGLMIFWKKDKPVPNEERFNPKDALSVITHPATWYIGFIIYGLYAMSRCLDLIAPYMREVMGIDAGLSAYLNTFRYYFATFIGGIVIGIVLDRTRHKIPVCQVASAIGAALFAVMAFLPTQGTFWHVIFVVVMCVAVFGVFGAYFTAFSLLEGARVPKKITGSIIGVAISIGFLPDIIINYLSNYLADTYGMADGCQYLLIVGAAHGFFAIIIYSLFKRYLKKLEARATA